MNLIMNQEKNIRIGDFKPNYKGENNFQILNIIYPQILDGKDLTQHTVQINIINQDNIGDIIEVVNPILTDKGEFNFEYPIPNEWTYKAGNITLWLKILNNNQVVGYTNEIQIPITDTREISAFIPEQQLTLLDQWTIRMNQIEASALQAVSDAQDIADNISIDYDLSVPNKIGIKKNSETTFTYTNDLKGSQGIQGIQGLSSYQVWLADGNTGTVTDYLNSLKGQNGDDGISITNIEKINNELIITLSNSNIINLGNIKGNTGNDGYTPIKGIDYFDGIDGQDGSQGIQGETGATGKGIVSVSVSESNHLLIVYSDSDTPIDIGVIDGYTKVQIDTLLGGKEPTISNPTPSASNFLNGLKGWSNFGASVRDTVLTGISFLVDTDIVATDTIKEAFGKIQNRITTIFSNIGDITTLATTVKSSIVGAINELVTKRNTLVSETVINTPYLTGIPSADSATDKIILNAHGLTNGTPIQFDTGTGVLPSGINSNDIYYVYNKNTNDFEIVTTYNGTTKVDITDNGTTGWKVRIAGVTDIDIAIPDTLTKYRVLITGKSALILGAVASNYIRINNNSTTGNYENSVSPAISISVVLGASSATDKYSRFIFDTLLYSGRNGYVTTLGNYCAATSTDNITYTSRINSPYSCTVKLDYNTLSTWNYRGSDSGKILLNGSKIILERMY